MTDRSPAVLEGPADLPARGRLNCRVGALLAATVLGAGAALLPGAARATDATWLTSPGTGDFDTGSNWTGGTVPDGTAFFGTSGTTGLSVSTDTTIGGWTFNSGASNYTFSNNFVTLTFTGAGIVINGGSASITNDGLLNFNASSTAGSASITNDLLLFFNDTSTAGSASITNNSELDFVTSSTAGSASITNNSFGHTSLFDSASGGTARFILNGSGFLDISLLTTGGTTAGSIEGDGNVFLGSKNLAVGGNDLSTTFSGVIQTFRGGGGSGSLTKEGTGTLTLTGTNTYYGATVVNAGTLEVDGSIAASSNVTVNSGGTLSGIGTVGPTTINGGTLSPGNATSPTGTLTVTGDLAFQPGSVYLIHVTPSAASSTTVSGSATLSGGTVNAQFASGSYLVKQYTILTAASGLGGTSFAGLTNTNLPAGFTDSLSYNADDAFLNLAAALGVGSGLNGNQQNVANAINGFFNGGGALPPNFVTVFGLTGGNLANALTQLSGEAATGAQQGAFELTNEFLGLMLDPFVDGTGGSSLGGGGGGGGALGFAPERQAAWPADRALAYAPILKAPVYQAPPSFARRWSAWAAGFGGSNKTGGDAAVGSHDSTARIYGYAGGLDYHFSPDTVAGFALAGGGTNWDLAAGPGGGKSDAFQAGVYGATRWGPAYAVAALAFANHWMSTDRFAFAGDHLTASFDAQDYAGRLEGGYRLATPLGGIAPYAAVQAQSFHTPNYSETDVTGGGFGLAYASRDATDTRSELGARFDHTAALDSGALLTLRGRLAWAHDWVSNPTLTAAFQALPGSSFIVDGAVPPENSALVSAGAELRLAGGLSLLAKFDGDFAAGSQTYSGTGTLRYTW